MEIRAFLALVVPFILVVYLAILLFIRAPRTVVLPSLLAGLLMGLLTLLFDVVAYFAHWWHYTLNGLTLHVPLPFYITPVLIYGSVAYLAIWRFWRGRGHWFALLILYGVPLFGILRDIYGNAIAHSAYSTWDSALAGPMTVLLWLVAFYAGFWLFWRLAPARQDTQPSNEAKVENIPLSS